MPEQYDIIIPKQQQVTKSCGEYHQVTGINRNLQRERDWKEPWSRDCRGCAGKAILRWAERVEYLT